MSFIYLDTPTFALSNIQVANKFPKLLRRGGKLYSFFNLLILFTNALHAQSADSLKADSSKSVRFPIVSGNSVWTSRRVIQNDRKLVAATPEQLMAGQMAGVRVIETNGAPGGVFSVQVRGAAALASSNEP